MTDMLDQQDSPTTTDSRQDWQEAMGGFRARAKRLFEAQQERLRSLERAIAAQLEGAGERSATWTSEPTALVPSPEEQELRSQLAQTRKLLNIRADELKKLRSQLAATASNDGEIDVEGLYEDISELRMERDQLVARIAEAEHRTQRAASGEASQLDELRQRFEKAVQEIRELKTKNVSLESQAEHSSQTADAVLPPPGFDWEEQKRQIMVELGDPSSTSITSQERLSIESTIRITDEVVARKDREIADLQAALNERSMAGGMTDEADVLAATLDCDEAIRSERDKLASLQEEWRDKLRQAEIDISVERAKLARDRAELESKLRASEAEREAFGPTGIAGTADRKSQKQPSGRWLSRLGLTKEDDE